MINKIKVLLLATNQLELAYVRLGDELREIENKVPLGSFGHSFEFISKPAVRASDLSLVLLKHEPHIVHFTGHGKPEQEIIFEDEAGNIKPVGVDELIGILRTLKDNLRMVFFNVCYSKPFAEAVIQEIDYAIGMNGPIEDEAAITFATVFYQTLAFGRTVKEAFEVAKNLARTAAPALLIRSSVNVTQPFISQLQASNPVLIHQKEDSEGLRAMIGRLVDGIANEAERLTLQRGVIDSQILLDEIESGLPGEVDPQQAIEVFDRNDQLHVKLNPIAYQQVKERLFPPPFGVPPPFPHFVFIGREDALADVKRLLGNTGEMTGQSRITVVRGWPGVGKTSLVGVIGRDPDIARMFPQGILWTSLEQKPNLLSEMARWGRALGTDEILRAPTLKEATAQLAVLLRHRRMLLIVDDVWDTAHAVPFTEVLGEQCALLATTRLTGVAEKLTSSEDHMYALPVLTEENSLKLLRLLVPAIVTQYEDECRELVRDLECLPLALHVAGNLLRSEARLDWGVTDLIREIRAGANLLGEPAPQDRVEGETLPTVSVLLTRSTEMLDEFTRDCFAFLGAFAPKPATFDLAAMQAVWEVDDPKPIVRKLVGHGLLEPVGSGRFQMHRILVDHAKSLCDE
jgi:NB-ARC domain/CHAT domain